MNVGFELRTDADERWLAMAIGGLLNAFEEKTGRTVVRAHTMNTVTSNRIVKRDVLIELEPKGLPKWN